MLWASATICMYHDLCVCLCVHTHTQTHALVNHLLDNKTPPPIHTNCNSVKYTNKYVKLYCYGGAYWETIGSKQPKNCIMNLTKTFTIKQRTLSQITWSNYNNKDIISCLVYHNTEVVAGVHTHTYTHTHIHIYINNLTEKWCRYITLIIVSNWMLICICDNWLCIPIHNHFTIHTSASTH